MTVLEITLIIIGVIFLIGSFFIKDKLSSKDIEKMAALSDEELKILVQRKLKDADSQIENTIDDTLTDAADVAKRHMEKETNEKIMAISEYSDTVLESINKSHNEIMFLYSMLNDKHKDLTELAGELHTFSDNLRQTEDELLSKIADAASEVENQVSQIHPKVDESEALEAMVKASGEDEPGNHNESILLLSKEGKSDVEIAKILGLGLGEVKLVLGLYKGEETVEA